MFVCRIDLEVFSRLTDANVGYTYGAWTTSILSACQQQYADGLADPRCSVPNSKLHCFHAPTWLSNAKEKTAPPLRRGLLQGNCLWLAPNKTLRWWHSFLFPTFLSAAGHVAWRLRTKNYRLGVSGNNLHAIACNRRVGARRNKNLGRWRAGKETMTQKNWSPKPGENNKKAEVRRFMSVRHLTTQCIQTT